VENTGLATYLDDFNTFFGPEIAPGLGGYIGGQWTFAGWLPHAMTSKRGVAGVSTAEVDPSSPLASNAGLVLDELNIQAGSQYDISIQILADVHIEEGFGFGWVPMTGHYSIFARMDNSNPNVTAAGVELKWRVSLPYSDKRTRVEVRNNGTLLAPVINVDNHESFNPKTLGLRIDDTANTATVLIDGAVKGSAYSIGAAAGRRVGFGITGAKELLGLNKHLRRVDWFRMEWTGDAPTGNRNVVVVAGGQNASATHSGEIDLQYEDTPNVFAAPTESGTGTQASITNTNIRHLQAAELLGRLYIVGEDSNETGTQNDADATKDVGAPIWQFNPSGTGSLVALNTSTDASYPYVSGLVPGNCSTIAAWRNRICVSSRDDPQNVFMSRSGIPGDWSYASIPVGSAIKFNTTGIDAGVLGEPVNALVAHSDDYLVLGCFTSLYLLRGDPTVGGQIDRLSSNIGIVAPQAWARGPNGETVFLSTDGLYSLPAGVMAYPQSISRERLPNELRDIDVTNFRVMMAYDVRNRGVFIGLTPNLGSGGTYWWFDWEFRGFWPMHFDPSFEPTSLVYRNADSALDQRLLFGCRDGNIRAMDDAAFSDDGFDYDTELLMGPIALGGGGYSDGLLLEIIGQTGTGSGDITCAVQVGNSIESARNATPRAPFTFRAGKNLTHRPRLRGNTAFLKLSSSGGSPWAFENLTITREKLGKQRL
jgi:hypothetical protein